MRTFFTIGLLYVAAACGDDLGSFRPAAYVLEGRGGKSELRVFSPDGKEVGIPIPLALNNVVFGASGNALYGTSQKTDLLKIELNPVRIVRLPGFESFAWMDRFAVSRNEDKILLMGGRDRGRSSGIFEVSLPDGKLRVVLETATTGFPWRIGDLAPGAEEALIELMRIPGGLALLDVASGAITPLGNELWEGSYSPDGRWLAALDRSTPGRASKRVLIDRKDWSRRRDLGRRVSQLIWSPDSQLLLGAESREACGHENQLALEVT